MLFVCVNFELKKVLCEKKNPHPFFLFSHTHRTVYIYWHGTFWRGWGIGCVIVTTSECRRSKLHMWRGKSKASITAEADRPLMRGLLRSVSRRATGAASLASGSQHIQQTPECVT